MAGHQPSRTLVLTSRRPLLYVLWAVTSTCSNSVLCNTRPALPIPGHDQLPQLGRPGQRQRRHRRHCALHRHQRPRLSAPVLSVRLAVILFQFSAPSEQKIQPKSGSGSIPPSRSTFPSAQSRLLRRTNGGHRPPLQQITLNKYFGPQPATSNHQPADTPAYFLPKLITSGYVLVGPSSKWSSWSLRYLSKKEIMHAFMATAARRPASVGEASQPRQSAKC